MFDKKHPILGSQHADVLTAEPETEDAKASLVEEIKNRARGIFASGNFPIAEILYDKAIKVKPDAVLYANRSAARLNLNMADAALADADKAIELDGGYSKAFYRKGQAHNARKEFAEALAAFERGLSIDPTNKTFAEQITKAKTAAAKAAAEKASKAAEAASTPSTSTTSSSFTSTSSSSSAAAAPAPPRKAKAKAASSGIGKKAGSDDEGEAEAALKAEELRGYKVLADGRKTTYFNNELSEETKKLIGDIAPKLINPAGAGAGPSADGGAGAGAGQPTGSAWNYAGTFEERNMTEWAKEKLKELLGGVSFVIPNVGAVVEVVKVKDVEGDAAVTFVRGKKKYLFDFVFTLDFELELACGKAKGSLKYPDVTPDNDDEYDTLLEVDPLTPPEARPLVNTYVKADSDGLQVVVKERLRQFMKEYQEQF